MSAPALYVSVVKESELPSLVPLLIMISRDLQTLTIFGTMRKWIDFSEVTGKRALSFRNLSVGETAGPDVSGQCGGGKTPLQISC
jgi:hypothetical protein